ncbi:MAG: endonuclease/exonuclease/phosphatase family protein [Acidimicrobiia bacterium]
MSVNLLHEHCDVARFSQVVANLSPEVVVTQELGHGAADVLASSYPNHRLLTANDYTGRGIATVFDVDFGDLEMPGRQGTTATLSMGQLTLGLAGVHFRNPVDFPWWATASDRRKQADELLEWVGTTPGPVVVAGDFNASPAWPTYKRMADELVDLIAEHASATGVRTRPTWGWRPGWPRVLRIDHLFGRGVRVDDYMLVPIEGSDHAAIVADLLVERSDT